MHKVFAVTLVLSAAFFIARGGAAEPWNLESKPFKGTYWLYSGTLIDRDAPTRTDRKISISITGQAAKEMFESMYPDNKTTCSTQKGGRERSKGDIFCAYGPSEGYVCTVGFNLRTGASIEGMVC